MKKRLAVMTFALFPVLALVTVNAHAAEKIKNTSSNAQNIVQTKIPQSAINPVAETFSSQSLFSLHLNPHLKTNLSYLPPSVTNTPLKLPNAFPYENAFTGDLTLGITYHFD